MTLMAFSFRILTIIARLIELKVVSKYPNNMCIYVYILDYVQKNIIKFHEQIRIQADEE